MNQARNMTADNTLFMRIASPAHVIMPLLGVVLSPSLHVKTLEFPALRLVYEGIQLNLSNLRDLKIARSLQVKVFDSAPITVRP